MASDADSKSGAWLKLSAPASVSENIAESVTPARPSGIDQIRFGWGVSTSVAARVVTAVVFSGTESAAGVVTEGGSPCTVTTTWSVWVRLPWSVTVSVNVKTVSSEGAVNDALAVSSPLSDTMGAPSVWVHE